MFVVVVVTVIFFIFSIAVKVLRHLDNLQYACQVVVIPFFSRLLFPADF